MHKTKHIYVLLFAILILWKTHIVKSALKRQTEPQQFKGIRFNTDLIDDRKQSTFLENYVSILLNDHEVDPTEISFCFRWQFYSMVGQCFFQETTIGIFFKQPSIHRVGYVVLYGAYVMFDVPKNIKFVPLVWHHLCVSYKQHDIMVVMDEHILLNKTIVHFQNLNSSKITLKDELLLGKLYLT